MTATMKRTILLSLVVLTGMLLPFQASAAQNAKLTAEQVLEKHVEAIGGRKALARHGSMRLRGRVELLNTGLAGITEIQVKAPNLYFSSTYLAGIGTITQGFDGTVGWSKDPLNGLRELSGQELSLVKRLGTFNAEADWRKVWKQAELLGTLKAGERDAYAVRLTADDGSAVTNYYDTSTFLLLRSEMTVETRAATVPITTNVIAYQAIDGVKVPSETEQILPTGTLRTTFDEISFDKPVDDALFAKPKE